MEKHPKVHRGNAEATPKISLQSENKSRYLANQHFAFNAFNQASLKLHYREWQGIPKLEKLFPSTTAYKTLHPTCQLCIFVSGLHCTMTVALVNPSAVPNPTLWPLPPTKR